jgi:DNA-directed RNA polymerase specialized sigma subunit
MLNCSTTALCRYLKDNSIKIKRKPKYDLNDIAKQIEVYYKEGYTNHYVIRKTGYSNGTICRAKKLIKNNLHT